MGLFDADVFDRFVRAIAEELRSPLVLPGLIFAIR